jgi:hypothetical protein
MLLSRDTSVTPAAFRASRAAAAHRKKEGIFVEVRRGLFRGDLITVFFIPKRLEFFAARE